MKFRSCLWLVSLVSMHVAAQNIKIEGSFQQPIEPKSISKQQRLSQTALPQQHVTLLKVAVSPKAHQVLQERVNQVSQQTSLNDIRSLTADRSSVQLGMDNVPVLDQGMHGTCVTFAVTAALDAVLNQGDNISQLCSLQLGRYIEDNAYGISGWDGSSGSIVLQQFRTFGFISKQKEASVGCGGVMSYPTYAVAPTNGMSLSEYRGVSEPLPTKVDFSILLDQELLDSESSDYILKKVKQTLAAGDRLTFGVLLADYQYGIAGAVGKYHTANDTWTLTPQIIQDIMSANIAYAGHEMIITGYDDQAIATDAAGNQYQGLLTLRNSWGSAVADHGNFYMTYDYFRVLVDEVARIRNLSGKTTAG